MSFFKHNLFAALILPPLLFSIEFPIVDQGIVLRENREFVSKELPKPDSGQYKKWRKTGRIHVGKSHLSGLKTTHDEQYLLAMSEAEATIRIYEHKSRKLISNLKVPGFEENRFNRGDVTFWPDSKTPLVLVGNDAGMNLVDGFSGDFMGKLGEVQPWQMAWSKDGSVLICSVSDISTQTSGLTFFRVVKPQSLEMVGTIPFENRVESFDLTSDNRFLVVAFYPSNRVELIDLHTGSTVWSIKVPMYTNSVNVSPDNRYIAIGGESLMIIDANDPSKKSVYSKFNNNIHKVLFSPSGDAVAVSSYDGRIRIFATDTSHKTARLVKTLKHRGTANVYEMVFIKDGSGLISSSGDQTIRFWGK